ncbi:MAG: alpha/beta hydrolase [Hominilimicola sp.]
MKNATKKIIHVSSVAAATTAIASLTSYMATKYLVKIALDREEPKALKRMEKIISKSQLSNEFFNKVNETSEKLSKKDSETVEIMCHDGTTLVGHWFPCENAERIIIAMHGWRSSWYKDFGMLSDFWENNNCSILYVEQRGQNNSGGQYMSFGLIERYDCLDWVHWVIERCGTEIPIYICGVSMGATTVMMASSLDMPENVHGIVADCGFTSVDAIWKHVSNNNLHLSYNVRRTIANNICKNKIHFGTEDYSTVDALKDTSIPVLLIHGTDDSFVPIQMTYENYKACNAPKKLFVVPGADHGMSYYVDKDGYEATVKEFWRQFD